MYAREEDIYNAIYRQLKDHVKEHYITDSAHRQRIQEMDAQITDLTQQKTTAWIDAMEHYDKFIEGEISKEEFRVVQDISNQAKDALAQVVERKAAYETQYAVFRKLLYASSREIPLSEIMDCMDKGTSYKEPLSKM